MTHKTYREMMEAVADPHLLPAIKIFESIGISRKAAYQMMNAGTVPAVKLGSRTMIRLSDWQNFIDNLPAYRSRGATAA